MLQVLRKIIDYRKGKVIWNTKYEALKTKSVHTKCGAWYLNICHCIGLLFS